MLGYQVRVTLDRPTDFSIRAWRAVKREAHRQTVLYWHRTYLKGHFTEEAMTKYGYQPRSPKYLARPFKRGKPPLYHSGVTYQAAVRGVPLVRAFENRARLDMATPSYVKMRPDRRYNTRPNLGDEMTRATYEEKQDLEAFLRDRLQEGVQNYRETQTILCQ
jgi:hypothetical protein